jgi:hypothetical protein
MNLRNIIFGRLFPLTFVVLGALFLVSGIRKLQTADESKTWPTTTRLIKHSEVVYQESHDSRSGTYKAVVLYEYTVSGNKYNNDLVAYGENGSSDISYQNDIANKYQEGEEVTVYYSPQDPKESVLEPGINGGTWMMPGIGFIFFCCGAFMLYYIPRQLKRSQTEGAGIINTTNQRV